MNQATPLNVDAYGRFMAEAFDERQIIGVPTGFLSFFGRPESGSQTIFSPDALDIDIDIIRGNERLAAMLKRGNNSVDLGQKSLNVEKFSTFSRKFPLIEETGELTADQLNYRVAGEHPYQGKDKLNRLRLLARNIHLETVRRILRTFEYLASLSILTGEMPAIIGTTDTNLIYDFLRPSTHIFNATTKWDGTTPHIFEDDIDPACDLIRSNGHMTADMMIIGSGGFSAFIQDATVQELADIRRFEMIEIGNVNVDQKYARFVAGGMMPRGRIMTPGGYELMVFTYNDTYENSSGVATKYLSTESALICSSQARCDRYFGPSELLPMTAGRSAWYQESFGFNPNMPPMPPNVKGLDAVVNPAMFYFDAFPAANQKSVTLRAQAAPIFATTQTDCFVTINDLLT